MPAWICNHMPSRVWDLITYPFDNVNGLHSWSLGMDKIFHSTLCNGCNYLCVLGLKLIHNSKRGSWYTLLMFLMLKVWYIVPKWVEMLLTMWVGYKNFRCENMRFYSVRYLIEIDLLGSQYGFWACVFIDFVHIYIVHFNWFVSMRLNKLWWNFWTSKC